MRAQCAPMAGPPGDGPGGEKAWVFSLLPPAGRAPAAVAPAEPGRGRDCSERPSSRHHHYHAAAGHRRRARSAGAGSRGRPRHVGRARGWPSLYVFAPVW
eukprot:scaffold1584_cov363-Prasinococcus_capsulatus_cf.AAC.3